MGERPLTVRVKRLRDGVALPRYMTERAAGMDVAAAIGEEITLAPLDRKLVPTGIAISLPPGYEAQIRPRSGLAHRLGITLLNTPGTIDGDFRGELCVLLINLGNAPVNIRPGDRIAQMIVAPVARVCWEEVAELDETGRSGGGFGHTGG